MIVREATVTDAEAIARVHTLSWQGAYRGLLPQDFLDGIDVGRRAAGWQRVLDTAGPRSATLLAVDGLGEVVGFADAGPSRDEGADPELVGELTSIYVLPSVVGTGCGRMLMAATCARMVEFGFGTATLWVLDRNARARRFYTAAGWRTDGAANDDEIAGVAVREVRYRRELC